LVIWMARSRWREVLELMVLRQVLLPNRVLETGLGGDGRSDLSGVREGFFRAKAQRFDANGGDACGYHYPLGGAVAATFTTLGLRVKTLDRLGLNVGGGCVVTLLRTSLWSSDFSQTCVDVFGGKSWFLFILICCVRESPHHLVSVLPLCGFIYKAGRKHVSRITRFRRHRTCASLVKNKFRFCKTWDEDRQDL
jgi:hypothetical protein